MRLPFTLDQFLDVFRRYNDAVCPYPAILWLFGAGAVVGAWRASGGRSRVAESVLALLWAWSGVVYHLLYFRAINPMAPAFALLFVVQAALILFAGRGGRLMFAVRRDAAGMIGGALVFYALVLYPVIGHALNHRYPSAPTFGVPCPVAIMTFGMLAWTEASAPLWLFVIPTLWAAIGTSAALTLGMREDLALPVAAVLVLSLVFSHRLPVALRTAPSR